MHKPEYIQENETQKILWDFEIQTVHLIPARKPDLIVINKKENLSSFGFCRSHHTVKNKRKRKDR